jgi:hypothetical protein
MVLRPAQEYFTYMETYHQDDGCKAEGKMYEIKGML